MNEAIKNLDLDFQFTEEELECNAKINWCIRTPLHDWYKTINFLIVMQGKIRNHQGETRVFKFSAHKVAHGENLNNMEWKEAYVEIPPRSISVSYMDKYRILENAAFRFATVINDKFDGKVTQHHLDLIKPLEKA